ncbi:MAG: hypothetical protein ACHRXM_39625 [Isosphaerales bacterium]
MNESLERRGRKRAGDRCEFGKTSIGRTTLFVLNMNHPDRVEVRRLLIVAGVFPL